MRKLISIALVAAALPSNADAQDASVQAVSSIERGFRACLLQISSNAYLTDSTAEALAADQLTARDDPPADVSLMASRLFPTPVYVQVSDGGEGTVWIVANKNVFTCKVTFSDHDNPLKQRMDFSGSLFKAKNWTYESSLSGSQGGLMREAFTLHTARAGLSLQAHVDGPQVVLDEGKGIQAIVTVVVDMQKDD